MPPVDWVLGASDGFNRSNEAILLSPWSAMSGESQMKLASNQAVPFDEAFDCISVYSGRTWNANHSSEALLHTGSGINDQGPGVCVRCQTSAVTYYRFVHSDGGNPNNCEIRKFVAGSSTQLDLWTTSSSQNDIWELAATGPSNNCVLTVYRNGTSIRTYTDTSNTVPASGSPGICYSSSSGGSYVDDWEGWEPVNPGPGFTNFERTRHPKPILAGRV